MPILGGASTMATQYTQVFCFERTAIPWLRAEGFEDPRHLPTGSNRRYFHPDLVDRTRTVDLFRPLTFAGNSWWTKAVDEPPEWIRRAVRQLRRSVTVDRRSLANGFLAELGRADLKVRGARGRYAVAQAALAHASMETRGRFALALKPVGLRLHGDIHWKRIAPGVDLRPFVDYEVGLPALFAASGVNANVTAEQMPTAVNQRVWDVPGTGGFLLTDAQEDALDLFEEDKDIVVYRDLEEAADKARYYLDHHGEAQRIAKRAFTRVERMHRVTHRLTRMAGVMKAGFK